MMDMAEDTASFLRRKDFLAFADIIDTLSLPHSALLHFSDDGVAVLNPSGALFAASFSGDCRWIDGFLPDHHLVVSHGDALSDHLERLGYHDKERCYLYVYDKDMPEVDSDGIRLLDASFSRIAAERYHNEDEYISERIGSQRLWGIFRDGELAGFGGFHAEGAMGMLEILPSFRHLGLGAKMESFLIGKALEEGRIPYCNVYISNTPSISLQGKLGLLRSGMLTAWMWRD